MMDRSVLQQKGRFQLSYELPHEASTSHVYPRQSSNGSTVVLYGHEHGLRIVWYAGRGFKSPGAKAVPSKVNGTAKSDPMVIDLDDDDEDDEPAAKETPVAPAEFEEEEEEVDPSAPYRDVIRYIDIPLGSAALRISVPHIAKDLSQAAPESWPSIYLERMIIAVACADFTIRLVSAPLDPPGPETQDVSKMDVQTVKIFGPNSHQQFISDIALSHSTGISSDQEETDGQQRAEGPNATQSKQEVGQPEPQRWSLLVASISCTGAGLLLVHQLPIQDNKSISTDPEHHVPIRRQYLSCSSMGAKLAFNTCPYPAERHSRLLVTFPAARFVKVYQIFPPYTRERRGSTATADSLSSTRSARTSGNSRGKFLITLLPSFVQDTAVVVPRRKSVLDARWIAGGRAIITLLEDGEFGIWDLEAVGPASSNTEPNLIRGQGNISGIHGGSLTKFAVRANIVPYVDNKQTSSDTQPTSGSLAPMTPSTRKTRSEGLFNGPKREVASPKISKQQGHIYVEEKTAHMVPHDEAVVISYAGENIFIPSIFSFWKSDSKPTRLPHVRLGGQRPRSFSLLSKSSLESGPSLGLFGVTSTIPDFLVQTSHRLILSVKPLSDAPINKDAATQTSTTVPTDASDLALLAAGDLDVDGMDRILDGMADDTTHVSRPRPMNIFTKSVGFKLDGDSGDDAEDESMRSPTPAQFASLKSGNASRHGAGANSHVPQRRIFT